MKKIKFKRQIKSSILRIKELELYKGKNVEIVMNIKELKKSSNHNIMKNAAGILNKYKNIKLWKIENSAWELSVRDKHENYRR